MNKEQIKSKFRSMSEEEQQAFLNMCVESYFELLDMLKKVPKEDEASKRVINVQLETYQLMINLFAEPSEALKVAGYDARSVLKYYYSANEKAEGQA